MSAGYNLNQTVLSASILVHKIILAIHPDRGGIHGGDACLKVCGSAVVLKVIPLLIPFLWKLLVPLLGDGCPVVGITRMLRELLPLSLCNGSVVLTAQIHETADACGIVSVRFLLHRMPARQHGSVLVKIIFFSVNGLLVIITGKRALGLAVILEEKPPGILIRLLIFLGDVPNLRQIIFVKFQAYPAPFHGPVVLAAQVVDIIALVEPACAHLTVAVKVVSAVSYIFPAFLCLAVLAQEIPAFFLQAVLAVCVDPGILHHDSLVIHIVCILYPGALLNLPVAAQEV